MTYQHSTLQKLISQPRIGTYRSFFSGHSEHEIYGIYVWNKVLCGTMYPLLQAVEIALRNAINDAAVNEFGTYWQDTIQHMPHGIKDDYNYTNLKNNFEKARKSWLKKENKKRRKNGQPQLPLNHKPDFNCVIAETDFSTWEFALHKCFSKLNNPMFLWPKLTTKVFKNWPFQSAIHTRNRAFNLVQEIRPFRNRLSHHEPLWKGVGITNEQQALGFINKKIDVIEELLNMICDEKLSFIKSKKLISKARFLASSSQLDLYRDRVKIKHVSVRRKNKFKQFIQALKEDDCPVFVQLAGKNVSIDVL